MCAISPEEIHLHPMKPDEIVTGEPPRSDYSELKLFCQEKKSCANNFLSDFFVGTTTDFWSVFSPLLPFEFVT